MQNNLLAITPIDGRYRSKIDHISQYFAEASILRYKTLIIIEWFIFLLNEIKLEGTTNLKPTELRILRSIYEQFDTISANRISEIEKITGNDTNAITHFIKEEIKDTQIEENKFIINFTLTAEDIQNTTYSCIVRDFIDREILTVLSGLVQEIYTKAIETKSSSMITRANGHVSTPTTMGKELINYVSRIEEEMKILDNLATTSAKLNGKSGNFNAAYIAYPEINWDKVSKNFIQSLGLKQSKYSSQTESNDSLTRVFDSIKRINTIIEDLNKDMYEYIGIKYITNKNGETLSPIHFETSEGELGMANSMLKFFSEKLPLSKLQQDQSSKTIKRNIGTALAYTILGYKSTLKGLSICTMNKKIIQDEVSKNYDILIYPVQIMMQKNKVETYLQDIKKLSEKHITKSTLHNFIKKLKINDEDKKALLELTPETYTGIAEKLVEEYKLSISIDQIGCDSMSCSGCSGC